MCSQLIKVTEPAIRYKMRQKSAIAQAARLARFLRTMCLATKRQGRIDWRLTKLEFWIMARGMVSSIGEGRHIIERYLAEHSSGA